MNNSEIFSSLVKFVFRSNFINNKKAVELSIKALVRIIIAVAVLFLVVFPACNKIRSYFFGADTGSFDTFVDGINEMSSERTEQFVLRLNEKSAVIGFSKDTNAFECYSCPPNGNTKRITQRTSKPDDVACNGKACICLCDRGFEAKSEGGTGGMEGVWTGRCSSGLICRELTGGINVVDKTRIGKVTEVFSSYYQQWNNGFMFTREVANADGFSAINHDEIITLYVEKKCIYGPVQAGESRCSIGVCNKAILDFNRDTLRLLNLPEGTCINSQVP